jgi:sugar (pentulose or hexulose) kinase
VLAILVATLGVDVVCAVIALLAERHGPQSQVHSFGTAIFWTSTQLLTVSSSMQNPVTTAGRVLDVFMELWAITVIAWLAGATGAFLHKRGEELEKLAPHAGR